MNEENTKDLPESATENTTEEQPKKLTVVRRIRRVASARRKKGISISSALFAVIITALFCILITFSATLLFAKEHFGIDENSTVGKIVAKITAIEGILDEEYIKEINEDELINSVLKGYMHGIGDNYAEYYTKEEFDSMMADLRGSGIGIGISVIYNAEYAAIEVVSVFPNSPAFDAGVKEGDLISHIYVDGVSVSVAEMGYEEALKSMLGEIGSRAEFTVFRGEGYSEIVEFSVVRAEYTESTVFHHLYGPDNSIGVIKITSFDANTPDQFSEALKDLTESEIRGIILDVRYNPGGELKSVCKTLDILLPEGPVIRTIDKNGVEEIVYTSDENETDIPMVVLANGSTASAGELFTAALRDYDKATVVGVTTYGKGSMQTTIPFDDGTGFKYTYRLYCPPFSDNYDGVGIVPDINVELADELKDKNVFKIEDSEDNQLAAAYEEILKKISK
ncbi:MAG: S41 family peptidase [Clostridia bacterium]|nr:S41 family peptidase [Clostridia bacterium]